MHLLTITEAISLGKTLGVLEPGQYLVENRTAFEIAVGAPRMSVKLSESGWRIWLNPDSDTVLVMRSGALGDLLNLTPALVAWKERNKKRLAICCMKQHASVFDGTGVVDEVVLFPLPFNRINHFCDIISLEETVEMDNEHHVTDVFAKALGVPTPLKDYRPKYLVTDEEKEAARKHVFTGRPTLAIQTKASVQNRNYPEALWLDVILKLEKQGWGIVLLGKKGQLSEWPPEYANPFIRDLSILDLPLRESVAVLSLCDAFCGVDSAMIHFAAALDLPAVGLYGPFPWEIRTGKAPNTYAINGTGPCAGCCWHMHNWEHFPKNKPCSDIKVCVVLAGIKTDHIVHRVGLLKP